MVVDVNGDNVMQPCVQEGIDNEQAQEHFEFCLLRQTNTEAPKTS